MEDGTVAVAGERYVANWRPILSGAVVGETYRIHVSVEGTLLGFADVVILDNGKGAQSLKTGETFPLIDNATLAIAFRIEEGAYIAGGTWTWVSGSSSASQVGSYGVQGVPAPSNVPGARQQSGSWTDASGDLLLFGGHGYGAASVGRLNDLWRFDGANWTWISGSSSIDQAGSYGTQGVPAPGNVPGARNIVASWIDTGDNLWLFGGSGYDGAGSYGYLNDLWRFDGAEWTWVSGSSSEDQVGVYGVQGVTAPANVPGARQQTASWIDASGNLWLFGGEGYGAVSLGKLNDLWRFDGANWTWISGSSSINQAGSYGTQGVPAPANVPGARSTAVSWVNSADNLWLFGGSGYGAGSYGYLNDLWLFNPGG
jgi:hypothetical protein